jgi:gamma-glutamyl:cysteine ligase YbdK (ATP-grasp superfamily)
LKNNLSPITVNDQIEITYSSIRKITNSLLLTELSDMLAETTGAQRFLKLAQYHEELYTIGKFVAMSYLKRGETIKALQAEIEDLKQTITVLNLNVRHLEG